MKAAILTCYAPSVLLFRMDMIRAMQAAGCEVAVLTPPDERAAAKLREAGVTHLGIALSRNGTNPFSDLAGMRDVRDKLRALQPDIFFCYHAKAVSYGLRAAKQAGVKRRFAMITGIGSILANPPQGIKARLVRLALQLSYRLAIRHATAVFFQNRDNADFFLRRRLVKRAQIRMIPGSGVNLNTFSKAPLPENRNFLFVGRLNRDKGVPELLEAARSLRAEGLPITVQVIGYFDTNPTSLSEAAIAPYIEDGSIEFLGFQEDVRPFLTECYAFVLPSYHEGTPRSVLEAMAVGRPIITTDAPGCRETVREGENGFLVPVGDVEALKNACRKLCGDPELAARMGARSRALCQEIFDVHKINAQILKELEICYDTV